MPSKNPKVILACGSNLAVPTAGAACRHAHAQSFPHVQTRSYAQHAHFPPVAEPSSQSHSRPYPHFHAEDLVKWPEPIHPHRTPTPYQILACKRGEAYTKHRFYALAKLYHPDACSHPSSPVSHVGHAECVERYRLIVAAHGILSDDYKRRAYDTWGAGWAGHTHITNSSPFEPRAWPAHNDPRHNATWEDWERWHERNRREKDGWKEDERTVYMSNFQFMSLIFGLVTVGGVVQGTRASGLTSAAMEQRDKVHKEASAELRRAQHATMMTGSRSERVQAFLNHREANLAGTGGEAYQRVLPPTETCGPESLNKPQGS